MNRSEVIQMVISFVKRELEYAESGHDWWHVYRVWKLSQHIAKNEKVDLFIVELGALLHDIADSKFYDGDESVGPKKARIFLKSLNIDNDVIEHVEKIILNISFRGGMYVQKFKSNELNVVQDADRLDALGAIGIARAFCFAGNKNLTVYNPEIKPNLKLTKEEYKNYKRDDYTQINHFYEKLLLLKNKMNTETGRNVAKHRHEFMEKYLKEFYGEWEGEL